MKPVKKVLAVIKSAIGNRGPVKRPGQRSLKEREQSPGEEGAVKRADSKPSEDRDNMWERCAELARSPRILDRFAADLKRCGVVGEDRAARLLYLILTTRLFKRPTSAKVVGQSSAGKSFLTQAVLRFFPPDAYRELTAMSEKALVYSDKPLSHKFLVLYENAGIAGPFASYVVRSLLSEGRLKYETVERTNEGLRPRLIELEGPTGLITTTTKLGLHPENETRLLSVPINDSSEQTRKVMDATAARAAGQRAVDDLVDWDAWHALQTWLEMGEHAVVIPFAPALAAKIPPVAVRLRRDFLALLSLIEAHRTVAPSPEVKGLSGSDRGDDRRLRGCSGTFEGSRVRGS